MITRTRLVVVTALAALVLGALSVTTAQAAPGSVRTVVAAGQDYYHGKLRARWKPVAGATYQTRWASSTKALPRATVYPTSGTSAYSPGLNRCVTHYVQVRAVRGGAVGPWSKPKGMRFTSKRPAVARLSGSGLEDGVRLSWGYVPYATRYRVRWDAAPFGKFPGPDTYIGGGWLAQTARSATLKLPTTPRAGDRMMGVAYANAVFAQIETNNGCRPKGVPRSTYVPVFPKAPSPGSGDKVRVGTYNVELFPTGGARIVALAANIADHGPAVVLLQEASADTAAALVARLGGSWRAVTKVPRSGQQILYRSDKFRLVSSGAFDVPNPKPGARPLVTPWARLAPAVPSSPSSQGLFVVSLHLAENPAASQLSKKASTGAQARVAIAAIDAANTADLPVVAAGDLRYMREPFCDAPGCAVEAPPTFVRAGYYDAMAALTKVNFQFATVNGHTRTNQARSKSGVGTRADYIMLKGFRSSVRYENVVNRFMPGTSKVTPSDHNLLLADLVVPYR